MRFLPLAVLTLTLTACAGKAPAPPPAPAHLPVKEAKAETAPEAPANPPAAHMVAPKEEASRFTKDSDLRESISNWIADHAGADYDEAARMANRFMRKHGYPMVLDAKLLLKKNKNMLRLKAGTKNFVFEAGKELSRTPDVCGERFLRIQARMRGKDSASLISDNKEYPFSLKGFQRDTFKVFKNNKLISTLSAPEPTEPIGLANNGKALYLKFPLNEEATAEWWQRMGNLQPSIMDEDPYLLLRVEQSRLYFDENIEHLPAQEFEVIENDTGAFRWRFQPSNLVLELSSKCN